MKTWTADKLPKPTTNLEQAKANIEEFGYCLVAEALEAEELQAVRQRLEDQAIAELQMGLAYEDGGTQQNWGNFRDEHGRLRAEAFTAAAGGRNQRIWMLINKGKVFCDMLLNEKVHTIVRHVLGEAYILSSHGANIAKPGGVKMDLHTDQWWMPGPVQRAFPWERQPPAVPVGSISRQQSNVDELTALSPQ